LPQSEPSMAVAGQSGERKTGSWGIIEID